jgi:hypothetical protein
MDYCSRCWLPLKTEDNKNMKTCQCDPIEVQEVEEIKGEVCIYGSIRKAHA